MANVHVRRGAKSHLRLHFDGATLFLRNLKMLKGGAEHFRAASGNALKEAIPNGTYWIQTDEIHKMTLKDDWTPRGFSKPALVLREVIVNKRGRDAIQEALITHLSAWGEYRIPIRQTAAQEKTSGRTNMFVHGGDTPGSAGCIDVMQTISILVNFLWKEHPRGTNAWIELTVNKGH